jgi:hypothetical protein
MTDADGAGPGRGAGTARSTPSGLRDPAAAVRGVGAAALATMALVLLLAIVPLLKLHTRGPVIGLVVTLIVVSLLLAGLLRRSWAWYAALAVPAALLAAFGWSVALGLLGALFALLWAYLLHVRRVVLRPPRRAG